jgi:hypothetical protein
METKIIGYWDEQKVKLKMIFPNLNEEDLCFYNGKENIMIELLANKLGKTKEELRSIIKSL